MTNLYKALAANVAQLRRDHPETISTRKLEYGVFTGTRWARTTSLGMVATYLKAHPGTTVTAMPDSRETWDAPTFRVCSWEVWPEVQS